MIVLHPSCGAWTAIELDQRLMAIRKNALRLQTVGLTQAKVVTLLNADLIRACQKAALIGAALEGKPFSCESMAANVAKLERMHGEQLKKHIPSSHIRLTRCWSMACNNCQKSLEGPGSYVTCTA